ncbi:glutathione-dependent formaldehyde-activating GFA [Rhizobium sp. PDO1-076]|uniref:GFA family protein n=1 Tax=Rhizobium sp. PDO1-076 TaxID=1125979 RepID=UPI00024E3E7E|nr:GFA family protein [Rhizobium sp. PDO1-076]EHS51334.1 glutathione-dependent formaldehyde-activating GFA [Rhizobium sp. PDO1-076]
MSDKDQKPRAKPLRGGCMCGAVEYESEDRFLYALNCHCSKCRRTTGSAFKPIAGLNPDDFRIVNGKKELFTHGDPDGIHDLHCRTCGSLVYSWIAENGGVKIHIPMGTLMDAPSARPTMHIFVGSKAPWYDINDDLPQYQGFP